MRPNDSTGTSGYSGLLAKAHRLKRYDAYLAVGYCSNGVQKLRFIVNISTPRLRPSGIDNIRPRIASIRPMCSRDGHHVIPNCKSLAPTVGGVGIQYNCGLWGLSPVFYRNPKFSEYFNVQVAMGVHCKWLLISWWALQMVSKVRKSITHNVVVVVANNWLFQDKMLNLLVQCIQKSSSKENVLAAAAAAASVPLASMPARAYSVTRLSKKLVLPCSEIWSIQGNGFSEP